MPATFDPLDASPPRPTLATAALPRRVRRALEQLYALISDETAPPLERVLAEFEQQLFRQADQARLASVQAGYLETLRLVRLRRADLIPRFLVLLEAALTRVREPAPRAVKAGTPSFGDLRLLDDSEIDEDTVLRNIAVRQESRSSLGLMLLGQRFGVLAGGPAFDAERLPVGPHRLGRIFAEACQPLQIGLDSRLDLYRVFDQQLMPGYAHLVEQMNALLARENVLPGLSFVPLRTTRERPAAAPAAADQAADKPRAQPAEAAPAAAQPRPHTAWLGQRSEAAAAAERASDEFATLQRWLDERRGLVDRLRPRIPGQPPTAIAMDTGEVLDALTQADRELPRGEQSLRKISELRQALLGRAQAGTSLSRDDGDVFELMDLLYGEIEQRLRGDSNISALLNRLQAPLLHAALRDHSLLGQQGNPALQLLNTVAEAGARWTPNDEVDPQLLEPLHRAVDHVATHLSDGEAAFDYANQRLQEQLQALNRKAEVTERRHVEAARGKEKLELAKRRANETIEQHSAGQRLPRFVQSLLSQAWADVLTLTWLRHGEDSEAWRRQIEITGQIVGANNGEAGPPAPAGLEADIEHALGLVGYHAEDGRAIAHQLSLGAAPGDDAASRTELAMKLRARGRLGEDAGPTRGTLPSRNEDEQRCWEQIRTLPFGSWFEFVQNQQGDVVRRRLSWFSTVTDNALFVNQRGQRVGEQSLDSLARMMARDQARVVAAERSSLVDRAWHAALDLLRGFGAKTHDAGGGA
ncbi:DUF1631 domain-containing protein [Lysobacter sp. BMK333-48F3]|uniref:DUF1631 family protein n=1 Tax=Lysobacter sp. BMK333-48F3 TaxID=2867962 RepID=UPI001C8C81F7|nr:DUF1631 family protein [Lysobacter sp. BMK333-48F3]MBX9401815.1 DUF1631 domain-containing protein [Lysobacter sp. BMK333-48F3]